MRQIVVSGQILGLVSWSFFIHISAHSRFDEKCSRGSFSKLEAQDLQVDIPYLLEAKTNAITSCLLKCTNTANCKTTNAYHHSSEDTVSCRLFDKPASELTKNSKKHTGWNLYTSDVAQVSI